MSIEITDQNFNSLLQSNKIVVVNFSAKWCGPCQALSPVIEQLSQEYQGKAVVGKMDVDKSQATSQAFGIRNIPAVVFFKNGVKVDSMKGGMNKAMIAQKINALL